MRDFGRTMLGKLSEKTVWPVIAAFALISAFLLGFYWRLGLVGVLCTGAKDEHCVREWISVTSTLFGGDHGSYCSDSCLAKFERNDPRPKWKRLHLPHWQNCSG